MDLDTMADLAADHGDDGDDAPHDHPQAPVLQPVPVPPFVKRRRAASAPDLPASLALTAQANKRVATNKSINALKGRVRVGELASERPSSGTSSTAGSRSSSPVLSMGVSDARRRKRNIDAAISSIADQGDSSSSLVDMMALQMRREADLWVLDRTERREAAELEKEERLEERRAQAEREKEQRKVEAAERREENRLFMLLMQQQQMNFLAVMMGKNPPAAKMMGTGPPAPRSED
ncbi:hypothetical protein HK101_010717 [Irineochytrium annulatum]|nr:hypothetical protein HK101_010717 [Irineochytrium annulatum]